MKVFGIGLSKTGTSSLAHALKLLDYNIKDCPGVTTYAKGDIASIDQNILANHDALTDTPIPSLYQELDKKYPGSKFILTIREMNGWLKSCKKQFNQKSADKQSDAQNNLFLDLYGTTVFDEDKFKQSYLDFVERVKIYFKDRPNDLLIIDVIKGEGWEKLCPFLDKPLPHIPFPKTNVSQIRWINIHQLAQKVRNATLQMQKLSKDLDINETAPTKNIKKAIFSFIGLNTIDQINRAAHKTQKLIEKELSQLNADISIISDISHDTPLTTRQSWNHFWLLSTTEGNSQLENGSIGYTINLALIEDGLPYLGITYSPAHDTLYYAALDKGVYKVQGNESPCKIESPHKDFASSSAKSTENTVKTTLNSSQGISYTLCQSIDNPSLSLFSIESSKEWQTAAGHAILKTLELTLIDTTNNTELKYNKESWLNSATTLNIP